MRILKYALMSGVAITFAAGSVQAAFVTFNGVPSSGNPDFTQLDSEGFRFTSQHFHTIDELGTRLAANGTIYIGHEGGSFGRIITMTKIGGGAFSLSSLDGAELWVGNDSSFPNATRIQVIGTLSGGGTITTDLTLDGALDGVGGINDFQHFTLSGYDSVTSVTFNGVNASGAQDFAFGIDNLEVGGENNAVPVPGGVVLFGLGLATLGAGRLVRRRVTGA